MSNFDPSLIGRFFSFREGSIPPSATFSQLVVPANGRRVLIAFRGQSTATFVRPGLDVTAGLGFAVAGANGNTVFNFADWGGVVGQAWYANVVIGAQAMYYCEVLYVPTEQ